MMIEDRSGAGYPALEQVAFGMMMRANQTRRADQRLHPVQHRTPRLYADIDRERAERLGVPVENVFATLGTYLGSAYINDFNFLGRTFRVTAQADAPYRDEIADIGRLRTRSDSGADGSARFDHERPQRQRSVSRGPLQSLSGRRAAGRHDARLFERPVACNRWSSSPTSCCPKASPSTGPSLPISRSRPAIPAPSPSALAVVFVFLLLAAQYESLVLPLAVILIVPMCLLAAILGVNVHGPRQQYPDPDRPGRADRPGRQERDPDRRIRQAGRGSGAWSGARPRGTRRGPACGRS